MSDRLQEIREREAKATEGPWKTLENFDAHVFNRNGIEVIGIGHEFPKDWRKNTPFIAHARSDIPYLLELVDALVTKLSKAELDTNRFRESLTSIRRYLSRTDILEKIKRETSEH